MVKSFELNDHALDLRILFRYEDFVSICNLQLGFNHRRSKRIFTIILKEVVSYYTNNDSNVHLTGFLDATKSLQLS